MTHLVLLLLDEPGAVFGAMGLWIFLSVGAVCLFVVFIPLTLWLENRRKEREAFYKADTLRRLAEASGESAKVALEMLREEDRLKRIKTREGMKIGGVINIGVGVGLGLMLYSMGGKSAPYLVGAVPALIGVAMLVYVYVMAAPVE